MRSSEERRVPLLRGCVGEVLTLGVSRGDGIHSGESTNSGGKREGERGEMPALGGV